MGVGSCSGMGGVGRGGEGKKGTVLEEHHASERALVLPEIDAADAALVIPAIIHPVPSQPSAFRSSMAVPPASELRITTYSFR